MSVYLYYAVTVGKTPKDETLKKLPLEAPCGKDCQRAIDAAAAFIQASDPAVHSEIRAALNHALEIFWRG